MFVCTRTAHRTTSDEGGQGATPSSRPVIALVRPAWERLTVGREPEARLVTGPRRGVITTATLRDATTWDQVVTQLGLVGLVRHGLRHTALTWMADSGVPLYVLQRVAGHQDPAVTGRYLHPDSGALTRAVSAVPKIFEQVSAELFARVVLGIRADFGNKRS